MGGQKAAQMRMQTPLIAEIGYLHYANAFRTKRYLLSDSQIALISFAYELVFFSMDLANSFEAGRGSDVRLCHAPRPLVAFACPRLRHPIINTT